MSETLFIAPTVKAMQHKDKCMDFLFQYFPVLKDNNDVRDTIESWHDYFSSDDIIRALTITVDKIKVSNTMDALLSYTRGILNYGTPVRINKFLIEKYELEKWLSKI